MRRISLESYNKMYTNLTFVVAECSDPGTPLNGRRTATTFVAASIVTFTCNEGFQLRGANNIRCETNGQWSSATPTCEPGCFIIWEEFNGALHMGKNIFV